MPNSMGTPSMVPRCSPSIDSETSQTFLPGAVRAATIDRAVEFVMRNTRHPMRVVGLNRIKLDEYPIEALREAFVNAVAHRRYEQDGQKILLKVFSDRVTIAERSLLGSHNYESPISAYVGVARRMRTTLSSVHHEVVLVHRDRRRNVVLCDDSAGAMPVLESIKQRLGLPELDARDINRVIAGPVTVRPMLGPEPVQA